MAIHWGVDSVNSANRMVPVPDAYLNGDPSGHRETVFDYVVRRMRPLLASSGRPEQPVFWGRYINGRYRSSRDEGNWIRGRGCRILPIFLTTVDERRDLATLPGGACYRKGRQMARRANLRARRLGIPRDHSVRIYLDLEALRVVNSRFFDGWVEHIHELGYRPGLYGRSVRVMEHPDRVREVYGSDLYGDTPAARRAREIFNQGGTLGRVTVRENWGSALARSMHRHSHTDVLPRVYLWSNEPRRIVQNRDDDRPYIPGEFWPASPAAVAGVQCFVWQYLFSCIWRRGGQEGLVDLNLANDLALGDMWA